MFCIGGNSPADRGRSQTSWPPGRWRIPAWRIPDIQLIAGGSVRKQAMMRSLGGSSSRGSDVMTNLGGPESKASLTRRGVGRSERIRSMPHVGRRSASKSQTLGAAGPLTAPAHRLAEPNLASCPAGHILNDSFRRAVPLPDCLQTSPRRRQSWRGDGSEICKTIGLPLHRITGADLP